jgi:crotonobetainyl-CoA:carnitine CoA-transferase CaiB-like acyl-CoA transferase
MALLTGVRVLEAGGGWPAAYCGRLLVDAGADVVRLMVADDVVSTDVLHAGKHHVAELDDDLVTRADVILEGEEAVGGPAAIRCVLTPYGRDGPLAGVAACDLTLQAVTGMLATTGHATDPPTAIGQPVLDYAAGLFGYLSVLAGLYRGGGETLEVATFDCAVSYLASYVPHWLASGRSPRRQGNVGTTTVPWNDYATADGRVVLCTSTDAQWEALLHLAGREDLIGDARYATAADRRARVDEIDAIVTTWTSRHPTADLLDQAAASRLAAGVVRSVAELLSGPSRPRTVGADSAPRPLSLLAQKHDRTTVEWPARDGVPGPPVAPLAGLRVVEIGHYTAGPYCCRALAGLGAEVIKVEPHAGEVMRGFPPFADGAGYFFAINNVGKQSIALDLRAEGDRTILRDLLRESDVLVENLSAGALDRMGLGTAVLHELNPDLVVCSIKGYGGAAAGRLAYDTIIQAEAGIMSSTGWPDSGPVKAGISISDLLGSTAAAAEIVLGLIARRAGQDPVALDVTMIDASAWGTQVSWADPEAAGLRGNRHPRLAPHGCFGARDGLIALAVQTDAQWARLADAIGAVEATAAERLADPERFEAMVEAWTEKHERVEILSVCQRLGVPAAPVLEISEVIEHPHMSARDMLPEVQGRRGERFKVLRFPVRFRAEPALVPIGPVDGDRAAVVQAGESSSIGAT